MVPSILRRLVPDPLPPFKGTVHPFKTKSRDRIQYSLSGSFLARRAAPAEKFQGGSCHRRPACYGQGGKVFRQSKTLE
jgi:hypothetical protein